MAAANAVVAASRVYAVKKATKTGVKAATTAGSRFKGLSNLRSKTGTGPAALSPSTKAALAPAAAQAAAAAAGGAAPAAGAAAEQPAGPWAKLQGHAKQMKETFGALNVGAKLKSFGDATVVAAADLESSRIGFDFLMSKLKTGAAAGKKGPGSAKELEQSIADYWTALRDNAQMTAFGADDVLAGGMKAIKLTKGDAKQAMSLVKLAEDMAAFNPGKSVKEAMEAIEAAKGQDYSKMKDFGLEFKKGSWNTFLKTADKWFQGGGEKLNNSANGMWEIVTEGVKASLQNAGVAALEQVKPVMLRLVNWLNAGGFKKLESLAAKTVDVFVKTFLWMADVLGPVFGWLENALDWVGANFETLRPILNGLIAAFAAFAVISTAMSVISGIGAAIALLSNPIFWVVAAIGLLTAAWTGNWFGIRDKTASAIDWIVSAYRSLSAGIERFVAEAKRLFGELGAVFARVGQIIGRALNWIYDLHVMAWSGIWRIVSGAASFFLDTIRAAFGAIGSVVSDAFGTLLDIGRAGMELLRGIFAGVWKGAAGDHAGAVRTITQAFSAAFGKVGALLSGFADRAKSHAVNFVFGYLSGLSGFGRTVEQAITPAKDKIMSALRIAGDVAAEAGRRIAAGFWASVDAIQRGLQWFGRAMTQLGEYLAEKRRQLVEGFWTMADRIGEAIVAGFRSFAAWATAGVDRFMAAIAPGLQAIGEFADLVMGIAVGSVLWGFRILSDLFDGFVDTALGFGERFLFGLLEGLLKGWEPVYRKIMEMRDSISDLFGGMSGKLTLGMQAAPGDDPSGLPRSPFDESGPLRSGRLSAEQRASMLQPHGGFGAAAAGASKSVAISNLVGEIHVRDEADEDRFIEKLKRMLEEDLLTEGEGVYAG